MAGETDLDAMLATLTVSRRADPYHVVSLPPTEPAPAIGDGVAAAVVEAEGVTVVCTADTAAANGWSSDFVAAWLTLDVHSSLDAVGLTAAFSDALAAAGIPCNVLAGYFHDHLLVPVERAEEARRRLEALREAPADPAGG